MGIIKKIIGKSDYKDWSIFKEFILTEKFKTAFKEIYKEEFEHKAEKFIIEQK